jgi:hypothetical protein
MKQNMHVGPKIISNSSIWNRMTSTSTIEIERKFQCSPDIIKFCRQNATNKREIFMKDIYFDNCSYALTTNDMWLRRRNDKLELKWPQITEMLKSEKQLNRSGVDFYLESTDLDKISTILCDKLSIPRRLYLGENSISAYEQDTLLRNADIVPFGEVLSNRVRYDVRLDLPNSLTSEGYPSSQAVFVDVDTVEYVIPSDTKYDKNLSLQYVIGEIELNNSSVSQHGAIQELSMSMQESIMLHVFQVMGIKTAPVRGKVLEYLHRFRPEHYEALRRCGQLSSKGL